MIGFGELTWLRPRSLLWTEELDSCGFSILISLGDCGPPKSPVGLCIIPLAVLLKGLSLCLLWWKMLGLGTVLEKSCSIGVCVAILIPARWTPLLGGVNP